MFMYGHDQFHGGALKIWVHEHDVIKDNQPFFSKNGYAYYHNKQGGDGVYRQFIPAGQTFIKPSAMPGFVGQCSINTSPVTFKKTKNGDYEFSTVLDSGIIRYLHATLFRDTYYALDKAGQVIGFAYIYMPPDQLWPRPIIRGILNSKAPVYIAEVRNDQPVCRYRMASH
jgi:hypothetical protein